MIVTLEVFRKQFLKNLIKVSGNRHQKRFCTKLRNGTPLLKDGNAMQIWEVQRVLNLIQKLNLIMVSLVNSYSNQMITLFTVKWHTMES